MKLKNDEKISLKVFDVDNEIFQGYAELKLVYGRTPVIEYSDINVQGHNQLFAETTPKVTKLKYFLSDIKDGLFSDTCDYVFYGKADKDNLRKVHFAIPELSPYFIDELNYKLDKDGDLSGNLQIVPLESNITVDGCPIKITINQGYSLKRFESNDGFGFTNIIFVSFELNHPTSFEAIKKLMYQTTNLFTWITGYPATVDEIEVSDGDKSAYLYIPSVKTFSVYDTSNRNSFLCSDVLRNNFDNICQYYFSDNKSIFTDIWSRTIPLFYFTGVLEYELMLYASVLDKYFSFQVNSIPLDEIKPNQKYEDFIGKLEQHLQDDIKLQDMVTNAGMNTTGGFSRIRDVFPNTSLDTFNRKAKAYLKYIGNFCTEVFINNNQLYEIKQVRDRAAHGEEETFSTDKVFELLWRLKMLSMYLIYKDIGINDQAFLDMLDRTFHPIKLNCDIDEYKLKSKVGSVTSISLIKKNLADYECQQCHIRVFFKRGETWTYDVQLSKSSSDYFYSPTQLGKNKEFSSYHEFVQNQLDLNGKNYKARFCGNAYLVTKKPIRLHSVIIIEKTK